MRILVSNSKGKIVMEKVWRKSAIKTIPIPLFKFGKQPKTTNTFKRLLEISYFKRDHEKGNLIFSFAPSTFYEKQFTSYELVTSLFELQNMFTKIYFWSGHLNLETGKKGKNTMNSSRTKKDI